MTKDNFKRANRQEYTDVLCSTDYKGWGNAKGKNKIKKALRRFSRRKLNQTLT